MKYLEQLKAFLYTHACTWKNDYTVTVLEYDQTHETAMGGCNMV